MKRAFAAAVLATATLLAGSAVAAPAETKDTVKLARATVVGSSVLPSGSYRVELSSDPETVRFVQGGKTVAEAPCKLGVAAVVYPGNAVHIQTGADGQDRLTKIVFRDSKIAIEVPAPAGIQDEVPIAATSK